MISQTYKYSRQDVVKMILLSEQTKDGFYWNTLIKQKLLEKKESRYEIGDSEYYLKREDFIFKNFYSAKDILYLTATSSEKLFVKDWIDLNIKFNSDNFDLEKKTLTERIGNLQVREIIDAYLFRLEYLFNI